jgi:hypothetical protein
MVYRFKTRKCMVQDVITVDECTTADNDVSPAWKTKQSLYYNTFLHISPIIHTKAVHYNVETLSVIVKQSTTIRYKAENAKKQSHLNDGWHRWGKNA